jgi:hypothetical protein
MRCRAEYYWEQHLELLDKLRAPGVEDVEVWELDELAAALKAQHHRLTDRAKTHCMKSPTNEAAADDGPGAIPSMPESRK